jgi:hypothetical protein
MSKITLRRYTQLAPLLHLLHHKSLTLLSPRTWDDTNDAYYLEIYRRRKNLGSVLALCFAEAPETYHHWHVFAGKSSGVCLQFEKDVLVDSLGQTPGIKYDFVKYPEIRDLRGAHPTTQELPFVKRYAFQDEREFRIIYEDAAPMLEAKDIPFNPFALEKVTINPWMPRPVFESVKAHLSTIDGWSHVSISRTTLVDNDEWKSFAESEEQASKKARPAAGRAGKSVKSRSRRRAPRG